MQLISPRETSGKHSAARVPRSELLRRMQGFSLVEVLVALLVISIGLLGIAKMQALALSNTAGARVRALAAIEADSLSATIQANRSYWSALTANLTVTITTAQTGSATITASPSDSTLTTIVNCATTGSNPAAPCTAHKMAGYDLQQWATSLQQVMGGSTGQPAFASIVCAPATTTTPVTCAITISWAEQAVAANGAETASASSALTNPSYTMVINP